MDVFHDDSWPERWRSSEFPPEEVEVTQHKARVGYLRWLEWLCASIFSVSVRDDWSLAVGATV